jgi:hypothetical protein
MPSPPFLPAGLASLAPSYLQLHEFNLDVRGR